MSSPSSGFAPTLPGTDSRWMAAARSTAAAADEQRHAIEFSASGSEYFRIWIVNLLLTLVTLGLYYPWAKVRRLRYFRGNTRLAGHAFDFHGDPARMLRGYLLMGALFAVYSLASGFSALAGFVALLVLAAIWPALMRASMRFRLANTSWRGLRFRFGGDVAGAYRAMLPAYAPAVMLFGIAALLPEDGRPAPMLGFVLAVAGLAAAGLAPLFWWMLKRWQHDHYHYAGLQTRFDAGAIDFYRVFFKAGAIALLAFFALGLLVALLAGLGGSGRSRGAAIVLVTLGIFVGYAAMILAVQPYLASRLQNLVWNRTQVPRALRFESDLGFLPLLGLTLKNWLLVLLTLGLYWPFAAVATARLKLAAVTVVTRTDLDALVDRVRERHDDAAGDAAGDLFDLDIGL